MSSKEFWTGLAIIYAYILIMFGLAIWTAQQAKAHHANTGWQYNLSCCSGTDCTHIPFNAVHQTPEGYVVTVTPAMHHQIHDTVTYQFSYDDNRIKDSKDDQYHICLSRQLTQRDPGTGEFMGGRMICFYRAPAVF